MKMLPKYCFQTIILIIWLGKADAIIEEAKKPYGQVELWIVDQIEKLVEFSKS